MPDTDSEIGTLGHEDRDLPKSGQKESLGYLNSMWLTQSASPDFYAHSRGKYIGNFFHMKSLAVIWDCYPVCVYK